VAALWLLNLDAELELAGVDTPPRAVRAAQARFAPVARALLAPGDVEWRADGPRDQGAGRTARAWCPTPRAHALLAAAGADTAELCAPDVVRAVLGRGFAERLRRDGERGAFVRGARELEELLAGAPAGEAWLAKRELSLAGRGRRRLRAGALTGADRDWIAVALARGGLQLEPWFEIEREYALHGELARDGALAVGRICRQRCDAAGSWLASEPAGTGELAPHERRALEDALGRAARALHAVGYHGPFGIDAFRHARGFRALSELNARHSMGWAVGFGRVERLEAPAREVAR
jgi:hypothetical protein